MKVAFRTHGGARTGFGHVRRCLSLAQALSVRGAECVFVVNDDQGVLETIRALGFTALPVDERFPGDAAAAISGLSPGSVVADSYDLSPDDLARLRLIARLVAIDDLADRELPADVVVNCAPSAAALRYRSPRGTRFLLGSAYAMLQPEYAESPARTVRSTAAGILLTLGGGDPGGLTGRMADLLGKALPEARIDVAIGPLAGMIELPSGGNLVTHRGAPSMRALMLDADLAVAAGGQTTYELAATGTPAVILAVADNQVPQSRDLASAGVFLYAGDARVEEVPEKAADLARRLAGDPALRGKMGACGRALVDGRGAERVAAAILGD